MTGEWRKDAACLGHGELFFPTEGKTGRGQPPETRYALHLCWSHCRVRRECLAWARREVAKRRLFPCVAGGQRWVGATKSGSYATRVSPEATPDGSACEACGVAQ